MAANPLAAVQSPADLLNVALRRIGYKLRVGSLYEGSFAAKQALDLYAQTRDQLLRMNDWGFAERNVAMTLLKSAPAMGYVPPVVWTPATNPPVPWLFEYSRPLDCLKIRAVKGTPIFVPNFDPQPNVYGEANDATLTPAQQVILCNVPNGLLVYTGQVTDPSAWEPDFVDALADELGNGLAPVLSNLQTAQLITALGEKAKAEAEVEIG